MRHIPQGRNPPTPHSSPHCDRGHQDHLFCQLTPSLLKMWLKMAKGYREARLDDRDWNFNGKKLLRDVSELKKCSENRKESCRGEQRRWETETNCQEVKEPIDGEHDEGMDGGGLGIACEKSRGGGEEMDNICSVYLLRSRMYDHNPTAGLHAFSAPSCISPSLTLLPPLFLCFLPISVISQHGGQGTQSAT